MQLCRAGQETPNVLLTFALFDVHPLEFVGVAEITRRVQNELTNSQKYEFPLRLNSRLNLYSLFEDIRKGYNRCHDYRRNAFGNAPK